MILRERLTLWLTALLPLHAVFVTVATKIFYGSGHAPYALFTIWKEVLLLVILCLCTYEIVQSRYKDRLLKLDVLDALILCLLVIGIVLGLYNGNLLSGGFIYGFKYDFIPLLAFLVARRVEWSEECIAVLWKVLLVVGTVVAGYGILTFFLPQQFFTLLGYSDLHSLYLPDAPLAAFQQIGGTALRRIQSTMSGPNQLGLWLLIPWSILLVREDIPARKKVALQAILATAIALTFSRSAWIAAAVLTLYWMWKELPRSVVKRKLLQLIGAGAVAAFFLVLFAPSLIIRAASTTDHIERPLQAMRTMAAYPLGQGLGSAGPASNRTSDACVHLDEGADATWAQDRSDLCVFTGSTQVQPLDRVCNCPLLPENWYLQIGVELGVLGFIIFVGLVYIVLRKLSRTKRVHPVFLMFLGISIGSLFLHAWEGPAVAYTVWILVSLRLQKT